MVPQSELPELGWSVVDPAVLSLGLKHLLADDRGHFVNMSLLNNQAKGQQLFLSGHFRDIEQALGSSPKQELKRHKACGCL